MDRGPTVSRALVKLKEEISMNSTAQRGGGPLIMVISGTIRLTFKLDY